MHALQVIIFMGPSCAGKSTLAKFTCVQLNGTHGETWQVVDFDNVGESIECLVAVVNECLQSGTNVIVDTNTYDAEIEKNIKGAATITKIIVTAPLDILLTRDTMRTQRLQRNTEQATRCRDFVIHSFNRSLTWPSDLMIDSFQWSVEKLYDVIFNYLTECCLLY
jgi:guanylate kinase